jgi:midasin (ATPase involved in ribosome maturation)
LRPLSIRDLIKLCDRLCVAPLDSSGGAGSGLSMNDRLAVFAECLDLFVAGQQSSAVRQQRAQAIGEALAISADQVDWYLTGRSVECFNGAADLQFGRIAVSRDAFQKTQNQTAADNFALTHQARALLEWTAAAIQPTVCEPVLLVGDTGCGKTTTVQYLAKQFGCRLHVLNMSQQSEASDLLGGYKPVDLRSHLILPARDRFLHLFQQTFSVKENTKFLEACRRSLCAQDWHRLCSLWRMGCQMARRKYEMECAAAEGAAPMRRIVSEPLRNDWLQFEAHLASTVETQLTGADTRLMFGFVEGLLVQALRNGDWILLDEINLASSETLECLSALLQSPRGSVVLADRGDDRPVERHPAFRLFACMNPSQDVGKRELPPGLRSRFTERWVGGVEELASCTVNPA